MANRCEQKGELCNDGGGLIVEALVEGLSVSSALSQAKGGGGVSGRVALNDRLKLLFVTSESR